MKSPRTATEFRARSPRNRGANAQYQAKLEGFNDARTGMPFGIPKGAMCVQRFDDSLNSAIHITYRISLRSSSMPEPRDPLLKVLIICFYSDFTDKTEFRWASDGHFAGPRLGDQRREKPRGPPKQQWIVYTGWKGSGHEAPGARSPPLINDPSAGSPTETLLRLLLPLNDRV